MPRYSPRDYDELQAQMDVTPPLGECNGPTGQHWILIALLKKLFRIICRTREDAMCQANRLLQERYYDR